MTPRRTPTPIDLSVVDALCRSATPHRPPTLRERARAVVYLTQRGYSAAQIGARVGRSRRQVQRMQAAAGVAGLPVGTNRWTRPRDPIQNPGKNVP